MSDIQLTRERRSWPRCRRCPLGGVASMAAADELRTGAASRERDRQTQIAWDVSSPDSLPGHNRAYDELDRGSRTRGLPARGPQNPDYSQHNMMIVGGQTIFLSHLPMFHSRHRFQVIVEATFNKDGTSLHSIYMDHRQNTPPSKCTRSSRGNTFCFRGCSAATATHYCTPFRPRSIGVIWSVAENSWNSSPISRSRVERVAYAEEVGRPGGARPEELDYILFGGGAQLFLAHRITQPPRLRPVIQRHGVRPRLTEELVRGVSVRVLDRRNSPAERLRMGETMDAEGHVRGARVFLPFQVEVIAEIYFEEGELEGDPDPNFNPFAPTALETEAGY